MRAAALAAVLSTGCITVNSDHYLLDPVTLARVKAMTPSERRRIRVEALRESGRRVRVRADALDFTTLENPAAGRYRIEAHDANIAGWISLGGALAAITTVVGCVVLAAAVPESPCLNCDDIGTKAGIFLGGILWALPSLAIASGAGLISLGTSAVNGDLDFAAPSTTPPRPRP